MMGSSTRRGRGHMGHPRSFPEARWERCQAPFRDEKRARHRARVLSRLIETSNSPEGLFECDGKGSQAPSPRAELPVPLLERVFREAVRGAICCIVRPHRSRELLRVSGVGVERTCRFEHCLGGVSRVWFGVDTEQCSRGHSRAGAMRESCSGALIQWSDHDD